MADVYMTVGEHLDEMGESFRGIITTTLLTLALAFLLASPYIIYVSEMLGVGVNNLQPLETMETIFMTTMVLTSILIIPQILLGFYRFMKPTFDKTQHIKIVGYISLAYVLGLGGFLIGVFKFSPFILGLINAYSIGGTTYSLYAVMKFVTFLGLAMAIVLETLIVIPLLNKFKIIDVEVLKNKRAMVFMGVLILSALITPPDVISQILFTLPFYLCFEGGIILTKVI